MRWVVLLIVCVWALAASPSAVRADANRVTPWSKGVPEAAQKRALQLFREGNSLFEQEKYTEAVAKYEQALTAWDHPSIRFNMALCLINMRQPLVAWDHLQRALRYGDAGLDKHSYAEAIRSVALLEASLAHLTVRSVQPGIKVMVDGAVALDGPGEYTTKLLPGKHQLVASRPGYITSSRALDLLAGKPDLEQISLMPEQVVDNYDRRWRWWVPWSVEAGGVVLALAATGVYLNARSEIQHHDQALNQLCPMGCPDDQIPAALRAEETSARRNSGVAIGMWVGAGALAITGGVMAVMNRPYKLERRAATPSLAVSRDYVGAAISFALE